MAINPANIWHGVHGEALTDHLTFLWGEGLSSGLIAERLGISRSAVCGKRIRMLLFRSHPTSTKNGRTWMAPSDRRKLKAAKAKRKRIVEPLAEPERCTLTQLTNSSCRYPLWGAYDPGEKFYCGVPQANMAKSLPYCRAHAALCLTNNPARAGQ